LSGSLPAVVVRSVLRDLQKYSHEGMPGLELVGTRGRSLVRPRWGRVRLAFCPEDIALVELSRLARASGHFFSEALRFRCASEAGGNDRRPYPPLDPSSLAACLAHPSATSFLGIPLCAGRQRINLDRRYPLAQGCYRLPISYRSGPGRVIRACASVKMRTLPSFRHLRQVALLWLSCSGLLFLAFLVLLGVGRARDVTH